MNPHLVDCFQRLVPTEGGCNDLVWVSLPYEWSRVLVMFLDEAIDGRLQIDDRMEHAVFQASPRNTNAR